MRLILLTLLTLVANFGWCDSSGWPGVVNQRFSAGSRQFILKHPHAMQLKFLLPMQQPRMIHKTRNGILLIGSRSGWVYRVAPPYAKAQPLIHLDDYPHSAVYRNGYLYIAQTDGVYRMPYQLEAARLDAGQLHKLISLPGGAGHNSRSLELGPDGRLYLSLGIRGNCSDQYLGSEYGFQDQRGGLLVLDESRSQLRWQVVASGLRNPVGYDWNPVSGEIFASNNGPDHHGYEQPPEYFARLLPGSFHGMPWFQFDGKQLQRDNCVSSKPPRPANEVSLPVALFPARNAPMGVKFMPQDSYWSFLQNTALVALHGSWATKINGDRRTRRPPAIVAVTLDSESRGKVMPLLTGLQNGAGERLARPLDIEYTPEGDILFTSDGGQLEGLLCLCRNRDASVH